MGQLQTRLVEHEVVHQQQVEVDGARPVPRPLADPAELAFDLEQRREERSGRQGRLHRHRGVEEPWLVEVADGIGLPERRHSDDIDLRPFGKELDRARQRRRPVAEIRSEPDVRARHHAPRAGGARLRPPRTRRVGRARRPACAPERAPR